MEKDILETGTYDLTVEELEYGVQLAWRNEPRCTARIQWGNLVRILIIHQIGNFIYLQIRKGYMFLTFHNNINTNVVVLASH